MNAGRRITAWDDLPWPNKVSLLLEVQKKATRFVLGLWQVFSGWFGVWSLVSLTDQHFVTALVWFWFSVVGAKQVLRVRERLWLLERGGVK